MNIDDCAKTVGGQRGGAVQKSPVGGDLGAADGFAGELHGALGRALRLAQPLELLLILGATLEDTHLGVAFNADAGLGDEVGEDQR